MTRAPCGAFTPVGVVRGSFIRRIELPRRAPTCSIPLRRVAYDRLLLGILMHGRPVLSIVAGVALALALSGGCAKGIHIGTGGTGGSGGGGGSTTSATSTTGVATSTHSSTSSTKAATTSVTTATTGATTTGTGA